MATSGIINLSFYSWILVFKCKEDPLNKKRSLGQSSNLNFGSSSWKSAKRLKNKTKMTTQLSLISPYQGVDSLTHGMF